jgi:hypothetical protein
VYTVEMVPVRQDVTSCDSAHMACIQYVSIHIPVLRLASILNNITIRVRSSQLVQRTSGADYILNKLIRLIKPDNGFSLTDHHEQTQCRSLFVRPRSKSCSSAGCTKSSHLHRSQDQSRLKFLVLLRPSLSILEGPHHHLRPHLHSQLLQLPVAQPAKPSRPLQGSEVSSEPSLPDKKDRHSCLYFY